jgi:hypothetical protein
LGSSFVFYPRLEHVGHFNGGCASAAARADVVPSKVMGLI